MNSWLRGEGPFTDKGTIHDATSSLAYLESETWSFYVSGFRKAGVFGVFSIFSITSFGDHNHPEHQETTPRQSWLTRHLS